MYDSYLSFAEIYGAYNTSIDRKDVYGDYTKDNCRWLDQNGQNLNKTTTNYITAFGETMPTIEYCRKYNINYDMLTNRLKIGISPNIAVSAPSRQLKEFTDKIISPISFFDKNNGG